MSFLIGPKDNCLMKKKSRYVVFIAYVKVTYTVTIAQRLGEKSREYTDLYGELQRSYTAY